MYSQFSEVKFSSVALAIAENSCQLYHIIMALKRCSQKKKKEKKRKQGFRTDCVVKSVLLCAEHSWYPTSQLPGPSVNQVKETGRGNISKRLSYWGKL